MTSVAAEVWLSPPAHPVALWGIMHFSYIRIPSKKDAGTRFLYPYISKENIWQETSER